MKQAEFISTYSFGTILLSLLFFLTTSMASSVTFPSGRQVDLSRKQLDRIKTQPGVFYIRYPKQNIVPGQITDMAVVEIPDDLGGGFLVGLKKQLETALSAAMVRDPAAQTDQTPSTVKAKTHAQATARLKTAFTLAGAYRTDDLNWNIAGPIGDRYINVLSELTWEDLEIFQVKLVNTTVLRDIMYARGSISYGWIYDGHNQDSDYYGDNRTLEFSRSNNNADDGYVWDGSIGTGPRFTFGTDFFEMMPLVGYSHHEQHLVMTDGFQTVPPIGSFSSLHSNYNTEWAGPWVGLDLTLRAGQPLGRFSDVVLFTTYEYHWDDYDAQADWNLRPDFAHPTSFEHEADAHGYRFSIGARMLFNPRWSLAIGYDHSHWETDSGTDRTFFADGSSAETPLNEVNWQSSIFSVGISYRF